MTTLAPQNEEILVNSKSEVGGGEKDVRSTSKYTESHRKESEIP